MSSAKRLEEAVELWPEISVHPHRFGGREFRFRDAEIGHVHIGGVVDIPFPRPLHDELLAEDLAEQHRWVPDSGWMTFRIRSERDWEHALWLLRLSYVRFAMKAAADPRSFLESESQRLGLNDRMKSLLEHFLPNASRHAPAVTA